MSKKILSLIVVLFTAITVFTILYYDKKNIDEEKDYKYSTEVKGLREKSENGNVTDEKNKNSDKNEAKDNLNSKEDSDNKVNKNKIERDERENDKNLLEGKITNPNNVSGKRDIQVFKINKSDIPEKLSFSEKGKLLYISRKLSSIDYGKINECLNSTNDEKAVKETLHILKLRLSEDDYNEVKNIMSRFINNIEYFEKINS